MASLLASTRLLVVTEDAALAQALGRRLQDLGYAPCLASGLEPPGPHLSAELVLYDIRLSDPDSLEEAARWACRVGLPLVLLVARLDRRSLYAAEEAGAYGCLVRDAADRELLTAIETARQRLRRERRPDRLLKRAITALTMISETRDPFTAGHQERVSRLAAGIARELDLSGEDREGVRLAGLVHDIGKVHVPSEILAKPDALSALEMGIVQGHCLVGYEILRDVPFPWPVARMVLEHHERQDGSGYPNGLAGEAILLGSRILGVADVVEAMTAHRPYRTALGLDLALAELGEGSGSRYDAAVAAACLAVCARTGLAIFDAVPGLDEA